MVPQAGALGGTSWSCIAAESPEAPLQPVTLLQPQPCLEPTLPPHLGGHQPLINRLSVLVSGDGVVPESRPHTVSDGSRMFEGILGCFGVGGNSRAWDRERQNP